MKQWLSYICILIFSLQVIPVKEIGEILFKGQITEEVHGCSHSSDDDAFKLKKEGDPFFYSDHAQACARIEYLTQRVNTAIDEAERLPKNFTGDIFSPPPDHL